MAMASASSAITSVTSDGDGEREHGSGAAADPAVGAGGARGGDDRAGPGAGAAAAEAPATVLAGLPRRPPPPSAAMYEKSYMHRDVVTHVAVSPADFFINGSEDGHLKFWKKKLVGIEFAKHFRSHPSPIEGLAIYDVVNYDMIFMMCLPFVPGAIEWVYRQGDVKPKLAVSDRNTPSVHIYDTHSGSNDPIISKEIHAAPVKVMKYNHVHNVVISADAQGLLEYWSPSTLKFPEDVVNFCFKTDTNLFEIAKCKTSVSAIEDTGILVQNWQTKTCIRWVP